MNYFKGFPIVVYDFPSGNKTESYLMVDITRNVRFRKELLRDVTLYDEYDIMDGETPEVIAEKVYGSPFFHWVVMLANERYNYAEDFPMSSRELEDYIIDKYGSLSQATNETMYYKNASGEIVYYNPATPHLSYNKGPVTRVTAYDYEVELNESKRRIKLIAPSLLTTVMKNFQDLM